MVFALVSCSSGLRMWANVYIGSIEEYRQWLADGIDVILGFNSWNF